jgi:hypothetical protein
MQPTMIFRHHKRLREATRFVELDIDRVVAVAKAGEVPGMVDAFIRANEDGTTDLRQKFVLAGRQRLFDQGDAHLGSDAQMMHKRFVRPALIGIEDDRRIGRCLANRADTAFVIAGADLDLQEGPIGVCARLCSHDVRFAERDREGGRQRLRLRQAQRHDHGFARTLGFQIPEGAVNDIARGAGRHSSLKFLSRQAGFNQRLCRFDLCCHAFHGLAITAIGNAFASAGKPVFPDYAEDHVCRRFGAPRDRECPRYGEGIRLNFK